MLWNDSFSWNMQAIADCLAFGHPLRRTRREVKSLGSSAVPESALLNLVWDSFPFLIGTVYLQLPKPSFLQAAYKIYIGFDTKNLQKRIVLIAHGRDSTQSPRPD